jgi:hypothetical protein
LTVYGRQEKRREEKKKDNAEAQRALRKRREGEKKIVHRGHRATSTEGHREENREKS